MAPNGHRNYSSEEDIEEVLELKAELSEKMHIDKGVLVTDRVLGGADTWATSLSYS